MGLLDPSTKAYKQRWGTYFYYNRAAIGIAKNTLTTSPTTITSTSLHTPTSMISNIRLLDYR